MRALLVVNPTATTTSPRVRSVLASALASEFKIDIVETQHRGHAHELARQASIDGLDVVVVLGGDGTVNEVVNGLLSGGRGPEEAPALAVVPGGSANVFARALGLPADPVEATAVLLDALIHQRTRTIGLGLADGRYFTFCGGLGMDAAAVRRVEAHRTAKPVTPWQYVRAATREFFTNLDRRHPALQMSLVGGEAPDSEPIPAHFALVCNTRPWTYLVDRPVVPCPKAGFDTGLDLFAMKRAHVLPVLTNLARMLAKAARGPKGRSVVLEHNLAQIVISSPTPQPFQLDGDYLGERESIRFESAPRALRTVI